ncbi:DUF4352 domain-containing protein [Acrocarpospora catenulata]|uniref:DUF4352 domain-containing protein n=1 Tax=Acrocarpospora catenulata TaxID=2836182 RepID=UPI001BDA8CCD|nr:DUF4352 domain-containing protein [Acrocarpospora catenulata]
MVAVQAPPATAAPPAAKPSFWGRAGRFTLGVALAAAAVYAQSLAMPFDQKGSFLTHHGSLGEEVSADRFIAKVTKVSAAKSVDTRDYSGQTGKVQTSHLFLVLDVSGTVEREPVQLRGSDVWLHAGDGRRYQRTDKVDESITLVGKYLQPGWWTSAPLVFEVPEDAVPGAKLVINAPTSAFVVDSFAPEAEIDLKLSEPAAARLIEAAEPFHPLVPANS